MKTEIGFLVIESAQGYIHGATFDFNNPSLFQFAFNPNTLILVMIRNRFPAVF